MQAKVSLLARVNDGTRRFPFIPAEIHRRAILLPVERQSDGRSFGLNDIIGFYARYPENGKRKVKPLGKDPVAAYTQFQQTEQDFARAQKGLLPINPEPEPPAQKAARDIRSLLKKYEADLVTRGISSRTIAKYIPPIKDFVQLYTRSRTSIDDVGKDDMMAYVEWMRTHLKRKKGDPQHTYRNRVQYVNAFLATFDVKPPMRMREIKKPTKKRPWKYSDDVLNLLLSKASREEKDLIHFMVNTGFRDEEASFAVWSDIDLKAGSINVHPKPQFANRYGLDDRGWRPKDSDYRAQDVVFDPKFVKIMAERKKRMKAKDDGLIFPTPYGNPDIHLIKKIRRAAKKAGFPTEKIALHAFRRTFGTKIAKVYGIEQARIWLGHEDIATTQRYIACDEMTTKEAQKKSAKAFAGIGD